MKYVTFFFLLLSIFPLKLDASTNLNSINKSIGLSTVYELSLTDLVMFQIDSNKDLRQIF